jgi:hypothetical protein
MKKKLGKRERAARKRRISMRKTGHMVVMALCDLCSKPETWKFGPAKANKIGFAPNRLLCGQCRSGIRSCAGVQAVGT